MSDSYVSAQLVYVFTICHHREMASLDSTSLDSSQPRCCFGRRGKPFGQASLTMPQ
ncbi:hypothetical protein IMZ48_05965 [Candidatus Bathyarchaeota archaeon]|nr:hypothetical protein [Candidatus Bathyarchaeota archaeon]